MPSPALNLDHVRSQFPGLSRGWTLFDNAGGSQILRGAVERMTEFLYEKNVQIGGSYEISLAAAEALRDARAAAATLMNAARPEEIIFGPSTTVLLQNLSRAMRSQLRPGDGISSSAGLVGSVRQAEEIADRFQREAQIAGMPNEGQPFQCLATV